MGLLAWVERSRKKPKTFLGDSPIFLSPQDERSYLRGVGRNLVVGFALRIPLIVDLHSKKA